MKDYSLSLLWAFNLTYLFWGGAYFLQDFNVEFIIYVGVLILIIGSVLLLSEKFKFPYWLLWMLSLWGLMHILGGAVETKDGVLFAYRIFPIIDLGGEFYILKYDQVVHFYLYGVVALFANYILEKFGALKNGSSLLFIAAAMISVGISVLNEIMEFIISLNMENGVGGYDNTMLDLIFNLSGAIAALLVLKIVRWKNKS